MPRSFAEVELAAWMWGSSCEQGAFVLPSVPVLPLLPLPPDGEGQNEPSWDLSGSRGGLESRMSWCLAAMACSALLMGLSLLSRAQAVTPNPNGHESGYTRNLGNEG